MRNRARWKSTDRANATRRMRRCRSFSTSVRRIDVPAIALPRRAARYRDGARSGAEVVNWCGGAGHAPRAAPLAVFTPWRCRSRPRCSAAHPAAPSSTPLPRHRVSCGATRSVTQVAGAGRRCATFDAEGRAAPAGSPRGERRGSAEHGAGCRVPLREPPERWTPHAAAPYTPLDMLYDLAIIGGGINGTGVARDAALRGLGVAIIEREDWGCGTTGSSTRMVHGGMRYLLYDIPTTRKSSEDAARVRRIAPHLTFRIPFLWPILGQSRFMAEAMDAFLSAYDRYGKLKGGLRHARLSAEDARRIEPGLAPEVQGALTLDEWGVDVYRLAALNAL